MNFLRSLLAKYMLLIFIALVLIQGIFLTVGLLLAQIEDMAKKDNENILDYQQIEEKWHADTKKLVHMDDAAIHQLFVKWQQTYQSASMFWVDGQGNRQTTVNVKKSYPAHWTPVITAKFIKERYDGDPFTTIAFVGNKGADGFVVLELPRASTKTPLDKFYDAFGNVFVLFILFIVLLFIFLSFLFFRSIRKRLLKLQEAMDSRNEDGLPIQINVQKQDEIGQLERTFNQMVCELKQSKQREQAEEQLRKELIASLSHDLRTPLTKVRAQTYTIGQQTLSDPALLAVRSIEKSMMDIDRLIENLLSYTLLAARKYNCEREAVDIVRFIRQHLAAWYSVFEKEGFKVEIELAPFQDRDWFIDSTWLSRILDNILQNVVRHAGSGKYIGVKTVSTEQYDSIVITDNGPGMDHTSDQKGAGIGLSIIDMMVKGLGLTWDIQTSDAGTTIYIKCYKQRRI